MVSKTSLKDSVDLSEKSFCTLQQLSSVILVSDNMSAIAHLMLDLALNYCEAEKGSLMLLNDQSELRMLAARGHDTSLPGEFRCRLGDGISGRLAAHCLPVLVKDIEKDERFRTKKKEGYKTKSFISCPISTNHRVRGVLNVSDRRDGTAFTEEEFKMVRIIANQAALAFENATLKSQLRKKAADLEEMNEQLMESDLGKTELLTHVAHELRTPLNAIKGAVYWLKSSERMARAEQEEFYDIIAEDTERLISIVENFLAAVKPEDCPGTMKKSLISLPTVLRELFSLPRFRNGLEGRNIMLTFSADEPLSDIVGDKMRVCQFFVNIVEGLATGLLSRDTVHISLRESDTIELQITLSREIPERVVSYLTNPQPVFEKTGLRDQLRLYYARKVADAHHWQLSVKSEQGSTLVTLRIPKNRKQVSEAFMTLAMQLFTELISELLGVGRCSIMLLDRPLGELRMVSAQGIDGSLLNTARTRLGEGICGEVAAEGRPHLTRDIESDPALARRNLPQYTTRSFLSLPLKVHGKVAAVVNLSNRKDGRPFTEQDLHIATALCERFSRCIEDLYSGEYSEEGYRQFITCFESLVGTAKRSHKKNDLFQDLMFRVLDKLGVEEEKKMTALYASMVYDLGMLLVEPELLRKKEITPADLLAIRTHPRTALCLLNRFEFADEVKKAILHHHERLDGNGYPDGLREEQIPFLSKVIAVIDSFCAMREERSYRKALTAGEALEELRKGSGSHYDPRIVETLEGVVAHNGALV